MSPRLVSFLSIVVLIALAGCTANQNAVYRATDGAATPTTSVDAKQRFLISTPARLSSPQGGTADQRFNEPTNIICTEPSPDAISVLSSAFSGGAGANITRPDSTAIAAQLHLAMSRVESGGYVGLRTQTIQLLRDGMYRLCEGYAAGALSAGDFKKLQRRYQSVMLALLAIEQITGAVAPRQALVSGNGSAATGDSLQAVQEKYADALKAQAEAENVAATAKTTLAAKDAALKTATDADTACKQTCAEKDAVKTALDAAKAEQLAATKAKKSADDAAKVAGEYSKLLDVAVGKAGQTLKTMASGGVPAAFADPTDTNRLVMTSAVAGTIADAARRIVNVTVLGGFTLEECMTAQTATRAPTEALAQATREQLCVVLLTALTEQLTAPSNPPVLLAPQAASGPSPAAASPVLPPVAATDGRPTSAAMLSKLLNEKSERVRILQIPQDK